VSPRIRDWEDERGGPSSRSGTDADTGDRLPTRARLYTHALRALARRELTTLQLREKLTEAGGRAADVGAVLARLTEEGALDDRRAARVYANTAFRQRKRTRARILQELAARGIAGEVAREVVDEICGADLERKRLDQSVVYALRGTRRTTRDEDARHIFAALVRQGYEPDDVKLALGRAGVDVEALDGERF
jgi:SOS response regulatory protein OraA/RecX